ncbi:MAG: hypothetical protein K1X39_00745 [Thermoflexales bacterium]|nr:hypothetical protein [Thermoflexales bacterium]
MSVSARARAFFPAVLIGLVALLPRLARLDLIDYRYDEAVAVRFALDIAGGAWYWLAPHSGSVATHPGLALWLMAIPAALSHDVLVIAGFRAALDALAAGVLAWALQRLLPRPAALGAALLYALGPWVVYFARKVWVAPINAWGVLIVLGIVLLLAERRSVGWVLASLGVALSLATHLSALYLLPAYAVLAVVALRRLGLGRFALGALPVLLVSVAYGALDGQTGYTNLRALAGAGTAAGTFSLAPVDFALWQMEGRLLPEVAGLPAAVPLLPQLGLGAVLLFGLGLLRIVSRRGRAWRDDALAQMALILAVFWASLVVTQVRAGSAVQPHYVQAAQPFAFALMGVGLAWLAERVGVRRARIAIVAVVALLLIFFSSGLLRVNEAAAARALQPAAGYRPLLPVLEIARQARALLRECGQGGIAVGVQHAEASIDEGAATYSALLEDLHPRLFPAGEVALRPMGCATWVIAEGPAPALAGLGPTRGPAAVAAPAMDLPATVLGTWEDGLELRAVRREGGAITALVAVPATPPATAPDAHWFVRVVAADGAPLGSVDLGALPPAALRSGDVLRLWAPIPGLAQSGGGLRVAIGRYRYPSQEGLGVRLPDGTWVAAVEVNP